MDVISSESLWRCVRKIEKTRKGKATVKPYISHSEKTMLRCLPFTLGYLDYTQDCFLSYLSSTCINRILKDGLVEH